jgi:hypothetical protein
MVVLLEMFQITNIGTKTRSRTPNNGSVNKRNVVTLLEDTLHSSQFSSHMQTTDMHYNIKFRYLKLKGSLDLPFTTKLFY